MVYGHQQWSALKKCDWGTLSFLYHSVALVKNRENETAEQHKRRAIAEAEADRKRAEDERKGRRAPWTGVRYG